MSFPVMKLYLNVNEEWKGAKVSGSMDERSWGCNNDVFNPTQPDFWAGLGNSFCNLG